jgi:hypothetical protein
MPSKPVVNRNIVSSPSSTNINIPASLRIEPCGSFPSGNPALVNAISPQLRKLAQYEQVCNGAFAGRSSFFVLTPTTTAEAQANANDVATKLKEYAVFGIKPLVFLEPDTANGNIDLNLYAAGTYDTALDSYFADLKTAGVNDAIMGMWVILPEGNIPVWSSTDPNIFTTVVTKTAQFQKKYFPSSQSTLLLDSQTYPSGASWGNGQYISLLPYVQSIPKGLIDSFGLQGFPWAPPTNQGGDKVYDPRLYLRTDLASEAAHALGVNNVWFNTGTFSQMYAQNGNQRVVASPIERQVMLNEVLSQAKSLQEQGLSVAIHLFAEDKSSTSEAIDWSYWQTVPSSGSGTAVFTTFVHDAMAAHVPLWLFDTADH